MDPVFASDTSLEEQLTILEEEQNNLEEELDKVNNDISELNKLINAKETGDLSELNLEDKRFLLIEYACSFEGNSYVWGGTSLIKGTDCSGFVQSVYAHFGYNLPRTSFMQRWSGEEITEDNIQKGDIVCYYGHVGIYVGNNKMINAYNSNEGITYTDIHYNRIISIRRIL